MWNVNAGHGRKEIIEAITAQLNKLQYYSLFGGTTHAGSIELSKLLVEMTAEEGMTKAFFATGGSEAVEGALKLARQYWKLAGKPDAPSSCPCSAPIMAWPSADFPPMVRPPSARPSSR